MDNVHKVLIFFFNIYLYTWNEYIQKRKNVPPDRKQISDFIHFFSKKEKYKKNKSFYTVVMCSLLIFLCICRLYIIVTKISIIIITIIIIIIIIIWFYTKNILEKYLSTISWCCVQKKGDSCTFFFKSLIYLSLHEIRNIRISPLDIVTAVTLWKSIFG